MLPENTVVHVPTQEDFSTLMEAYERVGWELMSENIFYAYGSETCIRLEKALQYAPVEFYKSCKSVEFKIIELPEALRILRKEFPEKFDGIPLITSNALIASYKQASEQFDSPLQAHLHFSTTLPKKSMSISTIAKRILSPNHRTLAKAKFLDSELNLTTAGQDALMAILFEKNIEELVKMAKEKLKEEKE